MKIVLDDEEIRLIRFRAKLPDAIGFKNPIEFLRFVEANMKYIELISLDHDLNFYEFTPYKKEVNGFDVCNALANMPDLPRDIRIVIHSVNHVGAKRMKWALEDAGFEFVKCWPFPWI